MSNELQTVTNQSPTSFVLDSMMNPASFDQLQRSATLYSKSGLVPASFKDNVAACFIGLQLACNLGVNPFMLFQGLYAISGKIGIETKVAVAIANQKGVFEGPITHEFKGEGKTRSCTARATLSQNHKEVSMTVDWETVEKEGWDKKPGSKWKTMPDQMFRYRSSMWLIRTYAPETLMGLNAIDEIQDSQVIDITPAKAKTIDQAFAEKEESKKKAKSVIAEVVPVKAEAEVVEAVPVTPVEKPVEEVKAEPVVEAKPASPIVEKINGFGLKPSMLTVYTMKAVGKNVALDQLSDEEATKVYEYIAKIKGATK